MIRRTWVVLVLIALLYTGLGGFSCLAEASQARAVVRYHFGDNARWANPKFDDSAWPVAQDGKWPTPAFQSDGYM